MIKHKQRIIQRNNVRIQIQVIQPNAKTKESKTNDANKKRK